MACNQGSKGIFNVKNLKEKYELLNQYVVNYVEGAKLPKDIFSDALRHFNIFAFDQLNKI